MALAAGVACNFALLPCNCGCLRTTGGIRQKGSNVGGRFSRLVFRVWNVDAMVEPDESRDGGEPVRGFGGCLEFTGLMVLAFGVWNVDAVVEPDESRDGGEPVRHFGGRLEFTGSMVSILRCLSGGYCIGQQFGQRIGESQVEISMKILRAGKHVLQEKPAASSIQEAAASLSFYRSLSVNGVCAPIWAIAENYRFEPALLEAAKLVKELGDLMNIQVTAEAPMNSLNPYFSSEWRRNFNGGFTLDVGVHFIAGLRLVSGCEVTSVVAITHHVDPSLPPPDNVSALFQCENGCPGVFTLSMSSTSRKISFRVVGSKGTVEAERFSKDGQHGYTVSYYPLTGDPQVSLYPFSGVNEELKAFVNDMVKATSEDKDVSGPDYRSSLVEGTRDVAVIEAMLQSSAKQGAPVVVEHML